MNINDMTAVHSAGRACTETFSMEPALGGRWTSPGRPGAGVRATLSTVTMCVAALRDVRGLDGLDSVEIRGQECRASKRRRRDTSERHLVFWVSV
jgi:hypothetical protein